MLATQYERRWIQIQFLQLFTAVHKQTSKKYVKLNKKKQLTVILFHKCISLNTEIAQFI